MLRFARRVAEQQLVQIDRWISAEERREAERQHGLEARPPAPDWLIERGLSGQDAVYVHTGDCWNAGKRSKGVDRKRACTRSPRAYRPARTADRTAHSATWKGESDAAEPAAGRALPHAFR